jgi:hypothetical protein
VAVACLENKNPLSWARFDCGSLRKKFWIMEERLIYLGKAKRKKVDEDFDALFEKYEKRAIEKGYEKPKLKLLKEKSIVKFYVIIDLE